MAHYEITDLTEKWYNAYQKVLQFAEVDSTYLRALFTDSYHLLEKFSEYELIPKEFCDLLCEMENFSWWVSDLRETPLHKYYREIVSLVSALKTGFLNDRFDREEIENLLNSFEA